MSKLKIKVVLQGNKKAGDISYEIAELKNRMMNLMSGRDYDIEKVNNTYMVTYEFSSLSETKPEYVLEELNKNLSKKSKSFKVIDGISFLAPSEGSGTVYQFSFDKKWGV